MSLTPTAESLSVVLIEIAIATRSKNKDVAGKHRYMSSAETAVTADSAVKAAESAVKT